MLPKLEVKSAFEDVRGQRRELADRVISQPQFASLFDVNLLCFFDDIDWKYLKGAHTNANLGCYLPARENWPKKMPDYLKRLVSPDSLNGHPAFEHVIYIHGSTFTDQNGLSTDETGLIMCFAHELQHCVQNITMYESWTESRTLARDLRLTGEETPHEQQAMVVAKGIAIWLCGLDSVVEHVNQRILDAIADERKSLLGIYSLYRPNNSV